MSEDEIVVATRIGGCPLCCVAGMTAMLEWSWPDKNRCLSCSHEWVDHNNLLLEDEP